MDTNELLTAEEAARIMGIKVTSVRTAMQEGRLPFVLLFGRRLIQHSDMQTYQERAHPKGIKPRGRPRKISKENHL